MPILDTRSVTDDLVAAALPVPQALVVAAKMEEAMQVALEDRPVVQHLDITRVDVGPPFDQAASDVKVQLARIKANAAERKWRQTVRLTLTVLYLAAAILGAYLLLS